jgi:hypothetical protein
MTSAEQFDIDEDVEENPGDIDIASDTSSFVAASTLDQHMFINGRR